MAETAETRVFVNLNAEWALVCAEPDHAPLVAGWLSASGVDVPDAVRGSLDGLLAHLEERDRAEGRQHSDRWLGVLGGEGRPAQLAARVVVQAMLHGAVRMTRRLLRAERDFDDVGQVVVAALYQVVRRYPLRRRRKVAANVLLETLHLASRELKADFEPGAVERSLDVEELLAERAGGDGAEGAAWRCVLARRAAEVGLAGAGVEDLEGARGELIELLVFGVAGGELPLERARVIAQDVREGGRGAAVRGGVSGAAWRQRRSRAVRQLRPVAKRWVAAA